MNTHLFPPRIMGEPAIGADAQYHIWVMWLDGISADNHVADPADKRYIENKRSIAVHSKGWESIWAAAVDDRVNMVHDGNYMKIPQAEKNNIMTRSRGSWSQLSREKCPITLSSPVLFRNKDCALVRANPKKSPRNPRSLLNSNPARKKNGPSPNRSPRPPPTLNETRPR